MHDNQFTATGPSHETSGMTKAAFSTVPPVDISDFEFGVHVNGRRFGVVGASSKGIFPQHGIAGVHGVGRGCKFGVLGTAMGNIATTGVVGASVTNTNNLNNLNVPSEEVELDVGGDGTGVLGMSGNGPGVSGSSESGPGVSGSSESGLGVSGSSESGPGVSARSSANAGLRAISDSNRGGVFQSGHNVGQINLVPLEQETREPRLPKDGKVGDLLLIRNTVPLEPGSLPHDTCSLWLCVPTGGTVVAGIARWREIKLGDPVTGTL
jgi:hypothetical protein